MYNILVPFSSSLPANLKFTSSNMIILQAVPFSQLQTLNTPSFLWLLASPYLYT